MNDIKQTIFRLLSIFLFLSFLDAVPDSECYDMCVEEWADCQSMAYQDYLSMLSGCQENPGTMDPGYASCIANAQLVYNSVASWCSGMRVGCVIGCAYQS